MPELSTGPGPLHKRALLAPSPLVERFSTSFDRDFDDGNRSNGRPFNGRLGPLRVGLFPANNLTPHSHRASARGAGGASR